jgi:condensin complex subunit 2
MTVRP